MLLSLQEANDSMSRLLHPGAGWDCRENQKSYLPFGSSPITEVRNTRSPTPVKASVTLVKEKKHLNSAAQSFLDRSARITIVIIIAATSHNIQDSLFRLQNLHGCSQTANR